MHKRQEGMILIAVLIIIGVLTTVGFSVIGYASQQYKQSTVDVMNDNAFQVAEAGIEQSVLQLNQSDNFAGYPAAQQFFNNSSQGKGTFTTVVAAATGNSNAKTITSTGLVYRYNTATVTSTRKIRVTVVGTGSSGYSVQSGPGGLILGGSANITNSSVFINGTITLTGTAKIGTASQPVTVNVANQACPTGATPGATYPTVCSSTQAISLAYSTNIYGTVCATGQTSTGPNNNIQGGSSGGGLTPGCTTAPVATPTYDRAGQIAAVTTTATGTSNSYVCASSPFNRTWPANLELTGNVSVASSCNVVIKGNTYITGDLNLGGASKITVDDSLGTTRPVVLVDGKITIGGSAALVANSSGTGIQFISWKSSAPCNPNCTSITGTDLKTSQGLETINVGGAANLPGMLFDAHWGKITLAGSGVLGAASGQTIDMSGAGTITFGTTLSSGSHTWTISSYQQIFN
jgi:Tfp pilus assembly protein PilX